MIEPQPVDQFSLAADAILARPAAKKASAVAIDYDPPYTRQTDDLTFRVEMESVVGRMVRQIRDQEESNARAVLKAAYDAGFDDGADAVSRCCGCSADADDSDFEGFLERLLKTIQED